MSTFTSRAAFYSSYPFTSYAEAEAQANGRKILAACAQQYNLEVRYGFEKPKSPVINKGRPVRSERFVYTKSGKKRTSRELCGRVFKKFAADRKAFVAAAIALGVRPATANAMFSHYSTGRYAV